MHCTLLLIILSIGAYAQVENGWQSPNLPTVVLQGQPRVVARRILRGQQAEVAERVLSSEPSHDDPYAEHKVNVVYADGPVRGNNVIVYRRVLRPAQLIYKGPHSITSQWVGPNDDFERDSLFRQGWYLPQNNGQAQQGQAPPQGPQGVGQPMRQVAVGPYVQERPQLQGNVAPASARGPNSRKRAKENGLRND